MAPDDGAEEAAFLIDICLAEEIVQAAVGRLHQQNLDELPELDDDEPRIVDVTDDEVGPSGADGLVKRLTDGVLAQPWNSSSPWSP